MDFSEYLGDKKHLQKSILDFIDHCKTLIMNEQLITLLTHPKYLNDKNELKSILYLILKIANDHHRDPSFFDKFKEIFSHLKDAITKNLSNQEVFNIFKENKRILLLLIKQKYFQIDQSMVNSMQKDNFLNACYLYYFLPEIKDFVEDQISSEIKTDLLELSSSNFGVFDSKRNQGENDNEVCHLIRKDSISEFQKFVEKTGLSFNSTIAHSIFETNSFLYDKKPTLIEYASFFGSLKIIKFLVSKSVKLTSSMWLYAIHSNSQELIKYLHENNVHAPDDSFKSCFVESIKCHHNEIADFIKAKLLVVQNDEEVNDIVFSNALKYLNYELINQDLNNILAFYYLCENDNVSLVEKLLQETDLKKQINTNVVFIFVILLTKFLFMFFFLMSFFI